MSDENIAAWWAKLKFETESEATDDAIAHRLQVIWNAKLVNRVAVHRYRCAAKGCLVGTIVRLGDDIYARTEDYKYGEGMNQAASVETARQKNTLDGNRHWPGHDFDVRALAGWGPTAGMAMHCRHQRSTVFAVDILASVEGTTPGKPGTTRL